ncbi:hypothetical protein HK105_207478 [Polyrhizophydium stewartii]|uniref:Anaphase-promoting complex subunit 4 n=1 Tax=Polyrhizophydium stewartii TaxID=2732419 RepID=A0ABR4N0M0_9FUNG
MPLCASPYSTPKEFRGRIRCLEWCPTRDVVAVLDVHGELRVMRVWEPVRTWSSQQTHEADMVAWSPDGAFVSAICSTGSVATFDVESPSAHQLELELAEGETITGAGWHPLPLEQTQQRKGLRSEARRLIDAMPLVEKTPPTSMLDSTPSLLVLATSLGRAIVVLNGVFAVAEALGEVRVLSGTPLAVKGPLLMPSLKQQPPVPKRGRRASEAPASWQGLGSWVQSGDGRSVAAMQDVAVNTILWNEQQQSLRVLAARFPGAASTLPGLGNMSLLLKQLASFTAILRSNLDELSTAARAMYKAQSDVYSEISKVFLGHSVEVSSAEFLKELLLGCTGIGLVEHFSAVTHRKGLVKFDSNAKNARGAAVKHYVLAKAAGDDALYTLGELLGASSASPWLAGSNLAGGIEAALFALNRLLSSLMRLRSSICAEADQFAKFIGWMLQVTLPDDIRPNYQTPDGMHNIICAFFSAMAETKKPSGMATFAYQSSGDLQFYKAKADCDEYVKHVAALQLRRIHASFAETDRLQVLASGDRVVAISHGDAVRLVKFEHDETGIHRTVDFYPMLGGSPALAVGAAFDSDHAVLLLREKGNAKFHVGVVSVQEAFDLNPSPGGDKRGGPAQIDVLPVHSCGAGQHPQAVKASRRDMFCLIDERSVVEAFELTELDEDDYDDDNGDDVGLEAKES